VTSFGLAEAGWYAGMSPSGIFWLQGLAGFSRGFDH